MGPRPIVLAHMTRASCEDIQDDERWRRARLPDDSILLKECTLLATQHPTVFTLVWPSGIDCACERSTPPPAYTPGMSSIGQKAPRRVFFAYL